MKIENGTRSSAEWDAFAESRHAVRLGHAAAWASVLSDAHGLESHYSWLRRRSRRAPRDSPPGVVQIQAKRPKAPDLSALFLDGFGILALDAEAADQLLEHALKLVTTHGFDGLDLRSSSTAPNQLDGSDEKAGVNLVL